MLRLALRYAPTLALVAGVGLTSWWLYSTGKDAGRAEYAAEIAAETRALQDRLHSLSDALSQRAAELEEARLARDDLERTLSDEARQDPMADSPGLGPDSLRRLDRIR